ncbi:MAG: hypothetical protein ABFR36_06115, partial [Acidobacteriota bacterium]
EYICICSDRLSDGREYSIPDVVRDHLEDCEQCRNSVLDIYSSTLIPGENIKPVMTLFSDEKPVRKPFAYRLVFRTAATFLILGFITAVYLIMDNKEPVSIRLADKKNNLVTATGKPDVIKEQVTQLTEEERTSSLKEESVSEIVHDPFKDNPNLEYMVNSHHRGRLIHIISPEFRILSKKKIVFMWENHIDKKLELKILNNLNETLFKFKAEGSRVEFEGDLSHGLYYWKLEDKENLYHVGKFLIEE